MWILFKLLSFGKTLIELGLRFVAWLCEDWLRIVIAGLAVLSAILWFRGNDYRNERDSARTGLKSEIQAHKQTEANYRTASAEALAAAKANKVRVETKYLEIENAQDKDIRIRLAAALNGLRSRAASSNSSGSNATGLSIPADGSVNLAGASEAAELDDALICTANTIKAQGWQDWYAKVSNIAK